MHIEEVTARKSALCAEILATLPHWFGIPESNAAYIRDVERMPTFAARAGAETLGFLALNRHNPNTFEIHVMGVKPEYHRHGAGRALVEAAAAYAKTHGAKFLTVKTLSHSMPDEGYARTRAFYFGMGFLELEEFPLLWNPENPALMLVKLL
ncbi:MAG: GNAT family N-acetyltransferase [Alphaproteobacteria bacterium]|nr:GNAT family N-acetyltransferase [Alphaproteobacteria bacterium]